MNIYAITSLIGSTSALFLGIFVYFKNRNKPINRMFGLLNLGIFVWVFGCFMESSIATEATALLIDRFLYTGASFAPTLFLHFSLVAAEKKRKNILITLYLLSVIFLILNLTPSLRPFFIRGVQRKFTFRYISVPGPIWYLYLAYFAFCGLYSFYILFKTFQEEISAHKREQLKYMILSLAVIFIAASMYLSLVLSIASPPIDNLMVAIFSFITAYAILRYRLMDINVALTRTGIFIAVYTLVLGFPFAAGFWFKSWFIGIFGSNWWLFPVGLMAALATLGPFIYIYIDRKAEERLLKQQRQYQNTLKQASLGMTRIRNLRKLLDLITHIVTKTVGISYAAIYLHNRETGEYVLQVSRDKDRTPIIKLTPDNPLIAWIMVKREPLIYEEVRRQMEDTNNPTYRLLEENMRLLTGTVIIPSFLEDRFMGFFVLGDKLSGQIYTPEDLNVFEVLASQAALAIENARFYEDTKQMQEQIAQAEKMATIGTMADGLSHQINNRFYALSLIAGDTIDTIKMTDTSKCSPEMQEMLKQINHALSRIQENVIQGGEVVKGILKYTRKGEEGFEALTLDQILNGTLDMVQYKVKLSEIDIIRNYSKDHPKIRGNSVQLQEAFFNFIDNGYDSTVERKTILKEVGYRGRITFSCQAQGNGTLLVTAEDNGMGIKEEDKKKLFTPFFTTKVSSRQGTGLGLYVIKRVIEKFHKGKIWFESEYGRGTRFFIQLPIA